MGWEIRGLIVYSKGTTRLILDFFDSALNHMEMILVWLGHGQCCAFRDEGRLKTAWKRSFTRDCEDGSADVTIGIQDRMLSLSLQHHPLSTAVNFHLSIPCLVSLNVSNIDIYLGLG